MKFTMVIASAAWLVVSACGMDLEFVSSAPNGALTWTNSITNATYRIEWAPSLQTAWRTNSPFDVMKGTAAVMTVEVPMFYRVVCVNPIFELQGSVYYSTNLLPNYPVTLFEIGWHFLATTNTDEGGHYVFSGLTNGTYIIGSPDDGTYHDQWHFPVISNANLAYDIFRYKGLGCEPTNSATVNTNSPIFAWDALPEASSYSFMLYDPTWNVLEMRQELSTNSYRTSLLLTNGVMYYWSGGARDSHGNTIGFTGSKSFTVALP